MALVPAAALGVDWVTAFCRDTRRAGGLRALHAELTGTAPATELAQAAVPWWQDQRPGFAEKRTPWPTACEPAEHAETVNVPPWHPDAASLTTGYTRWHAESLNELLNRSAS